MRAIVEQELAAGRRAGRVHDRPSPTVTVRAILTLTNYLAKSLSAEGRTKDDVIAIIQPMARALATSLTMPEPRA